MKVIDGRFSRVARGLVVLGVRACVIGGGTTTPGPRLSKNHSVDAFCCNNLVNRPTNVPQNAPQRTLFFDPDEQLI